MSPRTRRGLVTLASLTLATAAVGGPALAQSPSPADSAPATSAAPTSGPNLFNTTYPDRFKTGTPGGTVIFADWQEAHLFNPYYFNQVTEQNVSTVTNGGLITSTDDFKYAPDQAVSIPTTDNGGVVINADGTTTITWQLRDGLMWSDGQPLTCDDYSFTLDWILDPTNTGLAAGRSGYLTDAGLASYEATNKIKAKDINMTVACPTPTQMVWTLKEPYEGYLSLLPVPLPRHYLAAIPMADAITGKGYTADELPNVPVSGPFKFVSDTPGQELRLARNDNYKDHITGGPAYLDGFVFKWYTDADGMIADYQGAQPAYDVATDLNDADLPKLTGLNNVVSLDSLTYEFLRPNWDPKHCSLTLQPIRGGECIMSDPGVREALKYAIDKDAINQRLLGGNAAIAYTNVSPSAWFYTAPASIPTQNLDKAAAALDAAGWVVDPNTGFRFKNNNKNFTCDGDASAKVRTGDPAKECAAFDPATSSAVKDEGDIDAVIEACTTTRQVRQDTLAMVSGFMNQVGVRVLISPVSAADIFAAYNGATTSTPCNLSYGNYDLAEHAFSVPLDPLSNYPVYHSSGFEPNGTNDAHVKSKEIDAALTAVKNTVDFNKVQDAMNTFQQLYQDKTIEVPLYYRKEVYLQNPKLMNFTGNPTSTGPLWNAQNWWFQQ